ncbi:hypothetical protein [Halopelagius longus]|uniref:Uncharacterized protein n=1 Tax=Halopelagius longus TaxID=1236180 RepID=A0A1H1BDA1_9EURY|nr:hypothetical protein [Halopelagius longus]SDQ49853.1 hypothetical protein SAMN05216278_1747 [Halopelagius longus]
MGNRDPKSNGPLSPYFPSEVPSLPGNGRRWFAILLAAAFLSGPVYVFVTFLISAFFL